MFQRCVEKTFDKSIGNFPRFAKRDLRQELQSEFGTSEPWAFDTDEVCLDPPPTRCGWFVWLVVWLLDCLVVLFAAVFFLQLAFLLGDSISPNRFFTKEVAEHFAKPRLRQVLQSEPGCCGWKGWSRWEGWRAHLTGIPVYPWRLTWKITCLKRNIIFQTIIFRLFISLGKSKSPKTQTTWENNNIHQYPIGRIGIYVWYIYLHDWLIHYSFHVDKKYHISGQIIATFDHLTPNGGFSIRKISYFRKIQAGGIVFHLTRYGEFLK